ncbi:MAG: acetate/propionate family kinase [Saprospiraceae bacterium]
MKPTKENILTINAGSSSIKFAVYEIGEMLRPLLHGVMESIGTENTKLIYSRIQSDKKISTDIKLVSHNEAINILLDWLEKQDEFASVKIIGHRIVHGMHHTQPQQITPPLLTELKKISAYDPEHLPGEIKLIEELGKRFPALVQVACFDTSFHTSMPLVAKMLSIPRRYFDMGIQRYGFHGLSYAYLMEELNRLGGNTAGNDKVILAHLGNGASLAAVRDGKCMDTSMGFTPTSGLPMSTRSGDLDPGVAWYLMNAEKISPQQFSHLINDESGLLGISALSSDMRVLLENQATDHHAAEAIDMFCYQVKKWIGAYAAVLGGLDTLVFSGGIGERASEIRSRICEGLQFLGIELDERRNRNNEETISSDKSKVIIHVIKTNEELMIARLVCQVLNISLEYDPEGP